jgi:hypothetical protein
MHTASSRNSNLFILALSLSIFGLSPAQAGGDHRGSSFPAIDEVRLGVLVTDLEPGGASEDTIAINAELLTPRIGSPYDGSILASFLHPRLHAGFTVNTEEDGVNQAYAGLTWSHDLGERLFLETTFGGAVHGGETDDNNTDSYGCPLQFRESLSVGVHVTKQVSVMATVDHMSNANLCDENQGLTNAGVRLGYRW